LDADLWVAIQAFHDSYSLPLPPVDNRLTARAILRAPVEAWRMIGSEVFLEQARAAPITATLSVRAKPGYFRSELRQALAQVFTADQGGFFQPGRLEFGAALYASDIIAAAMAIEGVAVACLNRFARVGAGQPDQSADGLITCDADEYILCLQDRSHPESGSFRIVINEGEAG
jgi:hypothetical protein